MTKGKVFQRHPAAEWFAEVYKDVELDKDRWNFKQGDPDDPEPVDRIVIGAPLWVRTVSSLWLDALSLDPPTNCGGAFPAKAKISVASVSWSLMTWAYTRSVIEGSAWPSRAATACTGTPASKGLSHGHGGDHATGREVMARRAGDPHRRNSRAKHRSEHSAELPSCRRSESSATWPGACSELRTGDHGPPDRGPPACSWECREPLSHKQRRD